MSSGTKFDPDAARQMQGSGQVAGQFLARNKRLGMSPRQQRLNHFYSRYTCSLYDSRKYDWDGSEHADPIEFESISQSGFIPPGFYDAGATLPLKFRRPSAPYFLDKVITDRFTGLLFSQRKHPTLRVIGNPEAEKQIGVLAERSRLWASFMKARTMGGAMGSVAIGFQFIKGRPIVEVHDPRWLFPDFLDRGTLELRAVEKRYQFPKEVQDPETGEWREEWYWYRRVIDRAADTLFQPAPVGDGDEPEWKVQRSIEHGFGFCPVVWVQNIEVLDDIDGEHDCHGILELSDEIDRHLSSASRAILHNGDPTLVLATACQLDDIKKGSNNAIKLEPGSSVKYLELSGSGSDASFKAADKFRELALEIAQCVLENPDKGVGSRATATEIERSYSSMLAKADMLREQYGERGLKPLVQMMIRAAATLSKPRREGDEIRRYSVDVDLSAIDPEDEITVAWGPYFEPSIQDALTSAQAAAAAKMSGLIDDEHASTFVAPNFRIDDVTEMIDNIKKKAADQQAEQGDPFAAQDDYSTPEEPPAEPTPPPEGGPETGA